VAIINLSAVSVFQVSAPGSLSSPEVTTIDKTYVSVKYLPAFSIVTELEPLGIVQVVYCTG